MIGIFIVLSGLFLAPLLQPAHAASSCTTPANRIVEENCKPGSPPSEWAITNSDAPDLLGFATDISVNHGETVHFKIKTDVPQYRLDLYRLGFYGRSGARYMATVRPSSGPSTQPDCLADSATGLIDCGNWADSISWRVPSEAVSGIYLAKLVREDGIAGESHIVFIVRDDENSSDVLFQTSDTTWQAYNAYGGKSLYDNVPRGASRASKVSYNRPFTNAWTNSENWVFYTEYPMVRWLESNGYDVSYFSGVDTDRYGHMIRTHKTFLSVGHDEYWSAGQRFSIEAAREHGVHLAFFSGNEMFWKIRWEPSLDGAHTPSRTLVCYKETLANAKIDPDQHWTGTWRDPRFSPPADGGRPENAVTGTLFMVNGPSQHSIAVSSEEGRLRFWRHTDLATLAPNQIVRLAPRVLGYEWDVDMDNGYRPSGLFHLFSTTVSVKTLLQDHGATYQAGDATHHLTLYRHASGAWVFGAGMIQWSWGLDAVSDPTSGSETRMQQATVNLLADMGVQPATLHEGLIPAVPSTDRTPPTSMLSILSPALVRALDDSVTITGIAQDQAGRVAGVEVSTDHGATWHPTEGRERWQFTWKPCCAGQVTVRSRAVDDSGNMETHVSEAAVIVERSE
jgi:hypothetical protein